MSLINSLLILSLICCMPSVVYAESEFPLEEIYGEDLQNVPTIIRLKYQAQAGTSWYDASYETRADFLNEWQSSKVEAIEEQEQLSKDALRLEKQEARELRDKEKAKQARAKEISNREKAYLKEQKDLERKRRNLIRAQEQAFKQAGD